ncbi:Zn-ribbon domain-containing OB-fold protein [Variovorax sp. N23]|uniref:Zn-ribbon domain-containing OB-fold protein n=1 Tax=Variovorax sp. N23 TaxID=2980555 RepID=UPI0021C9AE30|nr:OB-fold domain-containing protein [Variovorax sp. N23]MCU4119102.1 OB-fold domain-containing protein [Variovorax sp. N23]
MHMPNQSVEAPAAAATAVGPDAYYARSLAEGRWQVQRCNACHRPIFFPRTACTACGSTDYTWFTPSGHGLVHSTTVMRRPPTAGGDLHLCLVDLEEGFRMMSRVEGIEPGRVAIGDPVVAVLIEHAGAPLVVFHPNGEGV